MIKATQGVSEQIEEIKPVKNGVLYRTTRNMKHNDPEHARLEFASQLAAPVTTARAPLYFDQTSRASLERATPIGHDHGAGPSVLRFHWLARPRSGVANPVRRQTWPWNGCGSLAADGTLLSLLLLLLLLPPCCCSK